MLKKYSEYNGSKINKLDLIIVLSPIINLIFAVCFTIEFTYTWVIWKLKFKPVKIDFDELARIFFGIK